MPFYSFSATEKTDLLKKYNICLNQIYYSKNNFIWKIIKKEKNKKKFNFQQEHRKKIKKIGKDIIFCLPPSIGLGDAIEYARAFKSIKDSNIFSNIAVAFTERFTFIFKNYFEIEKIFPYIISEKDIDNYDSVFHLTLEIPALINQKYLRSDIEKEINNYFKLNSTYIYPIVKKKTIKKVAIFPISNSPLRTMPINIIKEIVNFLKQNFKIEIYFDKKSEISNYIEKELNTENLTIINCNDAEELVKSIKTIEYGVFMDSGPLHVAKIFNKRGVLIESSVSAKILLNNCEQIKQINNNFTSPFCKSPCGLTDLFKYNKSPGCYHSLEVKRKDIIKNNFLELGSRRDIKNSYLDFIKKPVACLRSLNIQTILNYIKQDLSI